MVVIPTKITLFGKVNVVPFGAPPSRVALSHLESFFVGMASGRCGT
jgi:hypothetical protein